VGQRRRLSLGITTIIGITPLISGYTTTHEDIITA
jgi:hypothetical protein